MQRSTVVAILVATSTFRVRRERTRRRRRPWPAGRSGRAGAERRPAPAGAGDTPLGTDERPKSASRSTSKRTESRRFRSRWRERCSPTRCRDGSATSSSISPSHRTGPAASPFLPFCSPRRQATVYLPFRARFDLDHSGMVPDRGGPDRKFPQWGPRTVTAASRSTCRRTASRRCGSAWRAPCTRTRWKVDRRPEGRARDRFAPGRQPRRSRRFAGQGRQLPSLPDPRPDQDPLRRRPAGDRTGDRDRQDHNDASQLHALRRSLAPRERLGCRPEFGIWGTTQHAVHVRGEHESVILPRQSIASPWAPPITSRLTRNAYRRALAPGSGRSA